jgi:type IV pilus secretin PilQ/predicted competence protein
MACGKSAIAIMAVMMAAVFGCASSTKGRSTHSAVEATATGAADSPAASSKAGTKVQEAAFAEDPDGARLVLTSNGPLLYTAYEPRPDLLVVDLPGSSLSDGFAPPTVSGTLVSSLKIEPISEMGKQWTRLTIAHKEGSRYDVRTVGQGLAVTFDTGDATVASAAETSPTAALPASSTPLVASASAPVTSPAASRREPAHALEEVRVTSGKGMVTVSLLGDGSFAPRDFVLDNPPRIVIDLPGVRNEVKRRAVPVPGGLVSRVRISQFQSSPELVARVVIDLTRPMAHSLQPDGERLAVLVGGAAVPVAGSATPSRTIVEEKAAVPESKKETAQPPAARAMASTAAIEKSASETRNAASAPLAEKRSPEAASAGPEGKPIAVDSSSSTASPVSATVVSAPPMTSPPVPVAASVESPIPPSAAALRPARKPPAASPSRSRAADTRNSPREEALFEAAAAMLAQEEAARPAQEPQGKFQPRTLTEGQSQFTGEPISLHLKDADIKDVFRTISELTQLNIVVDPEVRGTVTVDLEDVPWDQALDLILKQNSLGYVLENNIMRIATSAKLQAEQSDRARLADARQAAEPTRTVIKKLSYAKAGEITPVIKSVMSRRGDIVVDARTNTLIIREIPTFLPAVLQLIENLDTATPQVMIEARIVETTKSLGRSLGINWGVNGVADVAHGNTTGLIFPNTIDFRGGPRNGFRVGLDAGPPVIGATFANILNTFSLDVAITAAENQGLLKIISSPKVVALTNTSATIQSGVQIPVQTNVNNTTTVIYVDATLQLTVTPQITNEGTILLDVNVQKREPAVALNLALGNNVPLTVRQYRGSVLVRDGGTAVIGGIFQINDQDQNNMIPGVWKIPILGNLFRNKTRTEKHDELLIFITPRIIRS